MIARKCLPIEQDLVLSGRGLIEAGHQHMQVCCESGHCRDFLWCHPDQLTHRACGLISEQLPWLEGGVFDFREMAVDPD